MRMLTIGLLIAATATTATAQNVCAVFEEAPPVGSWVEYQFDGQGQAGTSRIAVVGSETRNGQALTWYEMSFKAMGQPLAAKMLVQGGFYHAVAEGNIVEMIIKFAGQPAMTLSGPMLEQMRNQMNVGADPAAQFGEGCQNAQQVGTESVTVPAGTYNAVHYRLTEGPNPGDAWLVEDLPFGLIKWSGSKGETATLVGQGSDAVSQIPDPPM